MENRRILIVDDNTDIHDDFHKILVSNANRDKNLSEMEAVLFNDESPQSTIDDELSWELDDAYQGDEAVLLVEKAEREGNPYAVLFVDVRMPPGMNGIETIYRIWRKYPLIEMVICTAYSDYSWDEIVTKLGATDKLLFLKKPFNSVEVKQMALSLVKKWNLSHQVNKLITNLEDEVKERTKQLNNLLLELREKNRVLSEMAQRDSLTGLLNHGALYERLNAIFSESRRHKYPLSIIMLDIDFFKDFNDTYGHQAGDEILKGVAVILRNCLRLYDVPLRVNADEPDQAKKEIERYDVAGRYGGDEFIMIVPHCDKDGADQLAKRIHDNIHSLKLKDYPDIEVTPSIGICTLEVEVKCEDCRELIKEADKALYESKAKGRDTITTIRFSGGER